MDYELASYGPAQRDDYLRLLHDAWADDTLSGDEFDWWFGRNPAGSLMSVARDDRQVLGVAAHSLYRAVLGGEEQLASFSVHATTVPAARGRGIFVALERKHEQEAQARGVAVVLAFASAPTIPLFLGPLGWTEIARYRIWARALPFGGKRAEPIEAFEGGDAAAGWPNHLVRDAAYLNWRYLESPRDYAAFRTDGGYAVLGHKRHRGRDVALVADLAGPVRPALRASLAGIEARHTPRLRGACARPGGGVPLLRLRPDSALAQLHGQGARGPARSRPHAWRFTLGDTDFF